MTCALVSALACRPYLLMRCHVRPSSGQAMMSHPDSSKYVALVFVVDKERELASDGEDSLMGRITSHGVLLNLSILSVVKSGNGITRLPTERVSSKRR